MSLLDVLLPSRTAPSSSPADSFRLGTVTQLSPLRVRLDGDTDALDVTPINTHGPVIVGDRVWCQIHGKALLLVGSVSSSARDLYVQNFRSLLTGGGLRTASSTGVAWSARLIGLGMGRGPLGPSGFWDITMPPSGTVIPVYGHNSQTSATVGTYVPLVNWQALWYDPPIGSSNVSDPSRFKITSYLTEFEVPSTWVLLVTKNGDTGSFLWADGRETALWTYPTPASPWSNYGSGYAPLAYKREGGTVYLQGLLKGATTSSTGTIFTLPAGYRPAGGNLILINHASGGVSDLRVYTSGVVSVYAFLSGNASDVSLNGISFPADQ